jgi:hypothetical protein
LVDELVEVLNTGGVRYIIVGGVAGNLHGTARVTYDLDVVYDRSPDNIERLCSCLNRLTLTSEAHLRDSL